MSQAERFANLLHEFERVGVDPNTISAGLAIRQEDALRALAALPDGAGPVRFLARASASRPRASPIRHRARPPAPPARRDTSAVLGSGAFELLATAWNRAGKTVHGVANGAASHPM